MRLFLYLRQALYDEKYLWHHLLFEKIPHEKDACIFHWKRSNKLSFFDDEM